MQSYLATSLRNNNMTRGNSALHNLRKKPHYITSEPLLIEHFKHKMETHKDDLLIRELLNAEIAALKANDSAMKAENTAMKVELGQLKQELAEFTFCEYCAVVAIFVVCVCPFLPSHF